MKQHSKDAGLVKRMSNLRMLWDIEARVAMLAEKFPDVQQVLTLSLPPPEPLGGPELAPELARVANDGMAEICAPLAGALPGVRRVAADEQRAGGARGNGPRDRAAWARAASRSAPT